jgi:sugar lactone lactonase YvrE
MSLREIGNQLRSGRKLEAVRLYREAFNVSPTEATQAIESLQAGRPILMPGASIIGTHNIEVDSNPPITTTFTPQAVSTSSRGTTYTINAGSAGQTSFIVHWVRFSLLALPLAFVLSMLSLLFPNFARLAAPVWCPDKYIDAYGTVSQSYDSGDNSNNYSLVFNCVDIQNQVTHPNGFLAGATLFGLFAAAGVLLAFGMAALLRFKLGGCLPLLVMVGIVVVSAYVYISSIPSPSGNSFLRLFQFGSTTSGAATDGSQSEPPLTSGFDTPVLTFGEGEGQTAGMFDDTRQVAVDGAGNIYAADYGGGRIQVFDAKGQSVNQWQIQGGNVYITGLAAGPSGQLYVVYGGRIYQYLAATGQFMQQVSTNDATQRVVAVSGAGNLVAVSLKAINQFDATGKRTLQVDNWSQVVKSANANVDDVAVDKDGNIYLVDSDANAIYKFSAEGQFLATLGKSDNNAEIFNSPRAVALDSKGRLYVADFQGIQVFDAEGHNLGSIKVEGLGFDMVVNSQDQLIFMDRNANKGFVYQVP